MLYEFDNLLELDVKEADFHITKTVNSPLEVKTATKNYKFEIDELELTQIFFTTLVDKDIKIPFVVCLYETGTKIISLIKNEWQVYFAKIKYIGQTSSEILCLSQFKDFFLSFARERRPYAFTYMDFALDNLPVTLNLTFIKVQGVEIPYKTFSCIDNIVTICTPKNEKVVFDATNNSLTKNKVVLPAINALNYYLNVYQEHFSKFTPIKISTGYQIYDGHIKRRRFFLRVNRKNAQLLVEKHKNKLVFLLWCLKLNKVRIDKALALQKIFFHCL